MSVTPPPAFVPLQAVTYTPWSEVDALGIVVKIDGTAYPVIEASWTENAHGAADTLTVTVNLSTSPDFPTQLFRGTGPNPDAVELANASADVIIELWVGFNQNPTVSPTSVEQLSRWFLGEVDKYSGKFEADTVTFSARSLGAHFVDDTLTNVSANQTLEQFIAGQASKYGLPYPNVILNPAHQPFTIQEVLAYDQIGGSNYQSSLYGMHPLDLMIRGAQCDDTDTWIDVRDGTPNYVWPPAVSRAQIDLEWGRDWISLDPEHSPQFSDQVQVTAYAHQPRTRTSTTVSVSNDGSGNVTTTVRSGTAQSSAILGTNQTVSTSTTVNQATGTSSTSTSVSSSVGGNTTITAKTGAKASPKQVYPLYVGNVSPDRAAQMAQAYRRQISQHLYMVTGEVPITKAIAAALSITTLLNISGSPWQKVNGTYYPRSIEYTVNMSVGWRATITALSLQIAQGGV